MLKKEIGVSQLWTNFSNLQQLFVVLMTLVERVEINTPLPTEKDTVADIIRLVI